MRTAICGLLALASAGIATPAFAEDAPASDFTVSGGATLVSDYRFRGISQTDKRFAVQGTFTVAHSSGFYATVWGSSIDDYVYNGSDQEIDLIGGFRKTTKSGTTFDVGVLYYYYPGSGGINSDFFEPYASVAQTFGPVTAKASVAYAPKQAAVGLGSQFPGGGPKKDNVYVAGDFSAAIPDTPFALSAHAGHSFGPSYLVPRGKGYTDWGVGASYTWNHLTFGVNYVDTDDPFIVGTRNESKAGVTASVGVAF